MSLALNNWAQDVDDDDSARLLTTEMPIVLRNKKRTITPNITELRPCFTGPKEGPSFDIVCSKPLINTYI